jgi:hypothetical protein
MKRNILLFVFITGFINNTYSDFLIKPYGSVDFSSGTLFNNEDEKKNDKQNFVFFSRATLGINGKYQFDNKNTAGISCNLKTTALTSKSLWSYIYLSSDIGRFEFGSQKDAGKKMQIESSNLAKSKSWKFFAPLQSQKNRNEAFITTTEVFDKRSIIYKPGLKISYFTPKILDKIQFGISYIPDSPNTGYGPVNKKNPSKYNYFMDDGSVATIDTSIKHAISYGVSFEHNISDGVDLKLAFNGIHGKPSKEAIIKNKDKSKKQKVEVSNLNSYNFGTIITNGAFAYAISFGSFNKSFTSELIQGKDRDSYWLGLGTSYDQGPVGAAINYYKSNDHGNELTLKSFSTSYQIARGLKSYFEISLFNKKSANKPKEKRDDGTVLVLGMKVSF